MSVILIIEYCPSSCSGGAEQSTRSLCEELHREQHSVLLAYRDPGDYLDPSLIKIYRDLIKIELPVLTASSFPRWMLDVFRLRSFCLKHKVEFVFTHVIHAAPLLRMLGSVCRIETGMMLKWRLTPEKAGLKVRWGMAGIDRHVAVSEYTLNYWQRNGVKEVGASVVPEGFRSSICPDHGKKRTTEIELVFAARIIPQKGLSILLRSVRSVLNRNLPVKLIVAGKFRGKCDPNPDPYHCELESLVLDLGLSNYVTFVGFVSPIECLFAQSDLVVAPSILPEAHPLAVMGAMGVGTPVIATDVGGTKGIFIDAFKSFLVPANNEVALTNAIIDFCSLSHSTRQNIGRRMRRHIETSFPFHEMLKRTACGLGVRCD